MFIIIFEKNWFSFIILPLILLFNLTPHILLKFPQELWFISTQPSHFIQQKLHAFNSFFPIRLSYFDSILLKVSDSICISIFYSIWLSFLILFDYHYIHFNHHFHRFGFDSDILIQFDSAFLIQLFSEFFTQLYSVLQFDMTTFIKIIVSNPNNILRFHLTQRFWFN